MAGETQEDDFTGDAGGADEDAAMLLGFNTAMGEPSAAEAPASTATDPAPAPAAEVDHAQHDADQAARAEAEAAAAAQAAAEAEANAPVVLTRAQLADMQAKFARLDTLEQELSTTRDKFNGRIGNIQQSTQQAIDAVKAQLAGGQKMPAMEFKALMEAYPDLADILKQDFAATAPPAAPDTPAAATAPAAGNDDASGTQPGADSAPDPLQDPRVVEELQRSEQAEKKAHGIAVLAKHPDWKDVAKTPEFAQWRALLNPEAQQTLAKTWDSAELIPAFDAFKDWKAKRDDANKQRDKRLADAVPATSGTATGAHAPQDEDAAMVAGFNSARGR